MDNELKFYRFQANVLTLIIKFIPKRFMNDFIFWYADKHAVNIREIYEKIQDYETSECVKNAEFMKEKHKSKI